MRALGRPRAQRIALRLLLYGSAIFIGLPWAFSYVMTRAHPSPVASTPAAGYDAVELASSGLRLGAWIAEGSEDRPAFVIEHGPELKVVVDEARARGIQRPRVLYVEGRDPKAVKLGL